jgi:hypothetical protein
MSMSMSMSMSMALASPLDPTRFLLQLGPDPVPTTPPLLLPKGTARCGKSIARTRMFTKEAWKPPATMHGHEAIQKAVGLTQLLAGGGFADSDRPWVDRRHNKQSTNGSEVAPSTHALDVQLVSAAVPDPRLVVVLVGDRLPRW